MGGKKPTGQKRAGQPSIQELLEKTYRAKLPEYARAWKEYAKALRSSRLPASEFLKTFPVIDQVSELETWVNPEGHTISARTRRNTIMRAVMLEAIGQDREASEEADHLLKAVSSKPGAPVRPEIRRLAIRALETQRADPRFSWQRFANTNCPCRKSQHDIYCKERIRQSAMRLKRLLTELGVKV
jgi:hypothetical protein